MNKKHSQRFGRSIPSLKTIREKEFKKNRPFKLIEKSLKRQAKKSSVNKTFREEAYTIFKKLNLDTIEVMISMNGKFDNESCFSRQMSVDEFMEYDGEFKLYVAQYSIFNKMTPDNFYNVKDRVALKKKIKDDETSRLTLFFKNLLAPSPVLEFLGDIRTINMWINLEKSISKLHYDLYDNILHVVRGMKLVYLFPPECKAIHSKTKSLTSFHEGEIKKTFLRKIPKKKKMPQQRNKRIFVRTSKKFMKLWNSGMRRCLVKAGEAIRIPEGWYHYVISEPHTIGFNFWFKSCLEDLRNKSRPILTYLIQQKLQQRIYHLESSALQNNFWTKIQLKSFRITLLEALFQNKISFEKLLDFNNDCQILSKERLMCDFILQRLNEIDSKHNAELYLRLKTKGLMNICLTDPYKERFYELFFEHFNEKLRQKAVKNQEDIRTYLGKRSIDDFLTSL